MTHELAIQDALYEFVSRNRNRESGEPVVYRWEVLEFDARTASLSVRLAFLSGRLYCCCEPGCHLSVHSRKAWDKLRDLLAKHGVDTPARPLVIALHGVIEPGAVLQHAGRASDGFTYMETYQEPP